MKQAMAPMLSSTRPTAIEFSVNKSYAEATAHARFNTSFKAFQGINDIALMRRPDTYYDAYMTRLKALTLNEVEQTARTYLHPDAIQWILVGDAQTLRRDLTALGYNTTVYKDSDIVPPGRASAPSISE